MEEEFHGCTFNDIKRISICILKTFSKPDEVGPEGLS